MFKIKKQVLIGSLITLSGSCLYVLMGALTKVVGPHLFLNHLIFMQSLTGLVCILYLMKFKKYSWHQLWYQHQHIYFTRTLMSLASIYALICGLQYMKIFNALVILNLAPLTIPLLRKMIFKKTIDLLILPSVSIAFVGLVLVLGPDRQIIDRPMIIVVVSMLCMSFSLLLLEKSENSDPNLSIFYYFFYSTIVLSLILLFQHNEFHLSIYVLLEILIGVLFFLVQMSVVYAAQYISSQLISVLFYAEILIALIASTLFENMQLNPSVLIGTVLIVVGGLFVVLIENKEPRKVS